MGESAMEIKNRNSVFSIAWDKKVPAYYDLDGNSIYIELRRMKEDTYFDLSFKSNKPGMERVGINRIWLWMICPVCNEQCFGFIIANDMTEVSKFMKEYTLIGSDGTPLIDYGPKVACLTDVIPMFKEWMEEKER